MKYFTIDTDNNIGFAGNTPPAAELTSFSSEAQFGKLAKDWPMATLVEIWNSFAGAPPFGELKEVKKFTNREIGINRIWNNIQRLATRAVQLATPEPVAAAEVEPEPELGNPQGITLTGSATGHVPPPEAAAQKPDVAPVEVPASQPSAEPKKARASRHKAEKKAKQPKGERDTKMNRALTMLRRPNGATLEEVMAEMGWLQHTTRAFMSAGGTPAKKHGVKIESFKTEKGERAFRIPSESTPASSAA